MKELTKVGTQVPIVKRIGQGLILFVLLVLLGLVGAGINRAPQAVSHGGLIASVAHPNDPPPSTTGT